MMPRGVPNAGNATAVVPQGPLFTLMRDRVRGSGEAQTIIVPKDARVVRFRLLFDTDSFSTYSVTIETAEGREAWSSRGLAARRIAAGSKEITVTPAAAVFRSDDYVVRVAGGNGSNEEDVAAYSFRMKR